MFYIWMHVVAAVFLATLVVTPTIHFLYHLAKRSVAPHRKVLFHWHHHVLLAVVAWIVAGYVFVGTYPRQGGGVPSPQHKLPLVHFGNVHIQRPPDPRLLKIMQHEHGLTGGGALPPGHQVGGGYLPSSVSLQQYAGPTPSQGYSNACGSFSINNSIIIQQNMRGEQRPYAMSSGYWTYAHTAPGQYNGYTSFYDNLTAIQQYGIVPWSAQSYQGGWTWNAYNQRALIGGSGYQISTDPVQIAAAVASGHPVDLLTHTYSDMYNAWGASFTQNYGYRVFDHWITIVGYQYNYDGSLQFLVQNSWGTTWGQNGFIWLGTGNWGNTVMEADVYSLGAPVWPAHTTVAPAPHAPVVQKKVKPTYHAPAQKPVYYQVKRATWLYRQADTRHGHAGGIVKRYWVVLWERKQTPHWTYIAYHGVRGWVMKQDLQPAPKAKL